MRPKAKDEIELFHFHFSFSVEKAHMQGKSRQRKKKKITGDFYKTGDSDQNGGLKMKEVEKITEEAEEDGHTNSSNSPQATTMAQGGIMA